MAVATKKAVAKKAAAKKTTPPQKEPKAKVEPPASTSPKKDQPEYGVCDFFISQRTLLELVGNAIKFVPTRPHHPVFAGLKLTVGDDSYVDAYATDMESFYSKSVHTSPGFEQEAGEVLLPARQLHLLLKKALDKNDQEPVRVQAASDGVVTITRGRFVHRIQQTNQADWPEFGPTLQWLGKDSVRVDRDDMLMGVEAVATAAGRDDTLPSLTGIKLEINPHHIKLVATDRYRLATAEVPLSLNDSGSQPATQEYLVPAKWLVDALRAMPPGDIDLVPMYKKKGDKPTGFTLFSRTQWISIQLINGEFPKWRSLVPDGSEARAEMWIDRDRVIHALENAMAVAERNMPVQITPKYEVDDGPVLNGFTISVPRADEENPFEVFLEAGYDGFGEFPAIGVNPQYLLDGLGMFPDQHLKISATLGTKPLLIEPVHYPDFQYLLMPVRVGG